MNWTWDDDKNSANIQKHGISFETAILALDDPLSVRDDDPYPWERRFRTIGVVRNVVLVVVHHAARTRSGFRGRGGQDHNRPESHVTREEKL